MKLTTKILRQIISEEINSGLLKEDDRSEAVVRFASLIRSLQKDTQLPVSSMSALFDDAVQAIRDEDAGKNQGGSSNRRDLDEMCGDDPMQAIDMGVDHGHSEDHEGNMAKRQMFKTAEYAAEIFDNIQDGDEFPAWIQSKMTKIADYIGAVKHYLEYDHVMGEKLDKDADAGDYVKDFQDSDAPQFKGKSKKKKQQMAIAAYLDAKDNK